MGLGLVNHQASLRSQKVLLRWLKKQSFQSKSLTHSHCSKRARLKRHFCRMKRQFFLLNHSHSAIPQSKTTKNRRNVLMRVEIR